MTDDVLRRGRLQDDSCRRSRTVHAAPRQTVYTKRWSLPVVIVPFLGTKEGALMAP